MSKRIGRSPAGITETKAADDRRKAVQARLEAIDQDRKVMTPAQVREALSDVARIVRGLIKGR
jgi:hypothetical protein